MIYNNKFYKTVTFTRNFENVVYKDQKNFNENTAFFDFVHVTTSISKVYGRSLIDFLIPFVHVLK